MVAQRGHNTETFEKRKSISQSITIYRPFTIIWPVVDRKKTEKRSQGVNLRLGSIDHDWGLVFTRETAETLCIAPSLDSDVSVCPSVCHSRYCVWQSESRIVKCTPSDSPVIPVSSKVWLVEKFARGHPKERAKWVCGGFFNSISIYLCDFRPICRHISKTLHFRDKLQQHRAVCAASARHLYLLSAAALTVHGGHSVYWFDRDSIHTECFWFVVSGHIRQSYCI